jgi:hypothetical protein
VKRWSNHDDYRSLNLWSDRRFLPPGLRMGPALAALNVLAAAVFVALGVKGYWDFGSGFAESKLGASGAGGAAAGGLLALGLLAATIAAGWIAARVLEARRGRAGDSRS